MRRELVFAIAILAFQQFPRDHASANGAPFEAGAGGGIEFKQNSHISIAEETLHISSGRVRVVYLFRSDVSTPLTVDIAFPMPKQDLTSIDGVVADFSGSSDGAAIKTEKRTNYWYRGRDVTAILKETNTYPVNNWFNPSAEAEEVFKRERLCPNEGCSKEGDVADTMQEVFTWKQVFKTGLTKIEISYKPWTGGDYYLNTHILNSNIRHFGDGDWLSRKNAKPRDLRKLFCMDKSVEHFFAHKTDENWIIQASSVYYIWETARFWKGPIGKFHLIVEKDKPKDIISMCPNVAQKTSPTRFEWWQNNFVPKGMVRVLFMQGASE